MFSTFILSQILIGFAFAFDLASFQFKKREATLVLFFLSASLISAHFFLLGALTAGFIVAVSALRFFVGIFTTSKYPMHFFLIVILGLGLYTFDGREDFFAVITGIFGTMAAFQSNEKLLRQLMMVATGSIIIHNILIFSPAAIALEIFFLVSNLLSYWRFYLRKGADGQNTTNSLQNPNV
jgi:hypothetical protein